MRVHCKIHILIPLLFTACIGMHSTYRETIVAGSVRGNTASILSLAEFIMECLHTRGFACEHASSEQYNMIDSTILQ